MSAPVDFSFSAFLLCYKDRGLKNRVWNQDPAGLDLWSLILALVPAGVGGWGVAVARLAKIALLAKRLKSEA